MNGYGGLTIGGRTYYAMIHTANHEMALDATIPEQGWTSGAVDAGGDFRIGMGVSIPPGVTIGEGCEVRAGSVVPESLEPWSIAVGNSARPIGNRRAPAA